MHQIFVSSPPKPIERFAKSRANSCSAHIFSYLFICHLDKRRNKPGLLSTYGFATDVANRKQDHENEDLTAPSIADIYNNYLGEHKSLKT